MNPSIDSIYILLRKARLRTRLQRGFQWAIYGVFPTAAVILITTLWVRSGGIGESKGLTIIALSGLIPLLLAILGGLRSIPDHILATRIDRTSGLSDRLANAIAFYQTPSKDNEQHELRQLAIADGIHHASQADVRGATPFKRPQHFGPGVLALTLAVLFFFLFYYRSPYIQKLSAVQGAPGDTVTITGKVLTKPDAVTQVILRSNLVGDGTLIYPLTLSRNELTFQLPPAMIPETVQVQVVIEDRGSNQREFLVLHRDDDRLERNHERIVQEDIDYMRELNRDLREQAGETDPELRELTEKIEAILDKGQRGEMDKKEMLEALKKAEDEFQKKASKDVEQTIEDLKKLARTLEKNKQLTALANALKKEDLDKASQEFEKLAQKVKNNELSEKQRKQLAKSLENAAKQLEQADKKRDENAQKKIQKAEKQLKKLQDSLKKEKDPLKKQQIERQLRQKKRQLKELRKKEDKRQNSQHKRRLKRLQRNMKQAASQLKQKNQTQEQRDAVARELRELKKSTGKVSNDRRRIKTQKRVSSQLNDLKEAMRRARRRGRKGQKDRFGMNRRKRFAQRAQGNKPGQGPGRPGQPGGSGSPGGQGSKPGSGNQAGNGTDGNVMGDPTGKTGNTTDKSVSGEQGDKGQSVREVVLSAAQKGFANRSYKKVHTNYKKHAEEVMTQEKIPSGYRNYIRRYFHNTRYRPQGESSE